MVSGWFVVCDVVCYGMCLCVMKVWCVCGWWM